MKERARGGPSRFQPSCCKGPQAQAKPPLWLAVHEAGHAVAKLGLDELAPYEGPHIREVSLVRTEKHLGVVVADARFRMVLANATPRSVDHEWLCRLCIIETLAGLIAEDRQRLGSWWYAEVCRLWDEQSLSTVDAPFGDLRQIQVRLRRLNPPDAAIELEQLIQYTLAVLRSEWPGIVEVARVLRETVVMGGDDFERAWKKPRPSPEKRMSLLARSRVQLPSAPGL